MAEKMRHFLTGLSLSQRFMLAGLVILLAGMAGIGAWVGRQIEAGVIHRTGVNTALYVDSFVAPLLQELGESPEIRPEHIEGLSKLLRDTPMGRQIVAFKVWDTRGRLLYSTDSSEVGKTYPMHTGYLRARLGEATSELSPLDEVENAPLGERYPELLETYSPVWLSGTDQIIAVAEFYQRVDALKEEIGAARQRSWLVVGGAILLMYLLLSGFVRGASRTIQAQQAELGRRVEQLTDLLEQNQALHARVRGAAARVATLNESFLRRIGSELHDGPAQDLGLSLLKLDAAIGQMEETPAGQSITGVAEQLGAVQSSLTSALKDMRAIAGGLSLPHLADLSLEETVTRAVRAHERRTGSQVELSIASISLPAPLPVKITAYRLLQEALSNAYRHAQGAGQAVQVSQEGGLLVLQVSDQGPGFAPQTHQTQPNNDGRLGISGMRERVESLGGAFEIDSRPGSGTRLTARLPLQPTESERDAAVSETPILEEPK